MKIFLATPCYHAEVSLNYLASVLWQTPRIVAAGHTVQFSFTCGDAVNRQRNTQVHEFLASDCSDLLFVDSDTGYLGDDVNRMIAANVPVVGVNYPKREYFWNQAAGGTVGELRNSLLKGSVVTLDGPQETVNGMVPCAYIGTGLTLIKRRVFEVIADKKLVPAMKGMMHRFFSFAVVRGEDLGEDYHFCDLCRAAGFTVYYDPAAQASHMGWHEFKGRPQPAGVASINPPGNRLPPQEAIHG
jgi:hypothetical protein